MATIVTRTAKGSALTFAEVDGNFTNLNADGISNTSSISNLQNDKLDKSGGTMTGSLVLNSNLTTNAKVITNNAANSQSGSLVTLTTPGTEIVRLTNVLLTSLAGIQAGIAGQKLILSNRSGTTVTIENESSSASTSADQITTGTGAAISLQNNASISLIYDGNLSKWNIIGGTGSATGSAGINYIANPDASIGTTGYVTYNESDAVTFQDAGDTVTLNNHGLQNGQLVLFTSIVSTTGISINTGYFVVSATTNTFQLATSSGGSALPLTTNGSGVMVRNTPKVATGGTPPAGLFVRSTTSPLRGSGDFNIVKTGSIPYLGSGVAYDFTIDNADLAKVLTITFDYEVVSGTYATGDATVYIIQDPAGTPVVIQPAGYQIQAATVGTKMRQIATFQTASNVTSYRLCIHIASASTSDYTLALDSISVGPQVVQYGAPVTDWQAFTPTGSWTANTTYTGRYRRVGDKMDVEWMVQTSGAPTATGLTLNLPSGFSIDTSKILDTTVGGEAFGRGSALDAGVGYYPNLLLRYNGTTSVDVLVDFQGAAGNAVYTSGTPVTQAVPFTFAAGDKVYATAQFPILGWSSTVQMSNDTDTRVVAARIGGNTAGQSITANVTNLILNTVQADTHGAYNTSTGVFTAPVAGFYKVSGATRISVSATHSWNLYVDGVNAAAASASLNTQFNSISAGCFLNAGQQLTIRCDTSVTVSASTGTTSHYLYIARESGPSAIAASETVAARYINTAGSALTTSGTPANIPFATKTYDTHGAYNGSIFTVPISGKYRISGALVTNAVTLATTNELSMSCFKNGTLVSLGFTLGNGASNSYPAQVSTSVDCLAGDTLEIRGRASAATSLATTANYNWICIERIGN